MRKVGGIQGTESLNSQKLGEPSAPRFVSGARPLG